MTHQALGTPVDVRVVEARITHSWGIDQGGDFGEVLGAKFVESVNVRIFELGQVLGKSYGNRFEFSSWDHIRYLRCTSQAGSLWTAAVPENDGSVLPRRTQEVIDLSRSVGCRSCNDDSSARFRVFPFVGGYFA